MSFHDHFSVAAEDYALARPRYPQALFDWIAAQASARDLAWEPGCGSGQATVDLARRFARVLATDPSAAQIAQAPVIENVTFAIEPGERSTLSEHGVDAVCVAQALHWFDLDVFFDECTRVLKPAGILVAWGYQDIVVPPDLALANAHFQRDIEAYWPPQRAMVDAAYAGFDWPLEHVDPPHFMLEADWPLARLLAYFSSYSAVKEYRERIGHDPIARHAPALAAAWGDPETTQHLQWPLFVHARRAPGG